MSDVILLDSGPLGLISNPLQSPASSACNQWLQALLKAGKLFLSSELCDYEVRRELLRASKLASIHKLDSLRQKISFLPVTDNALRQAAKFWAQARNMGKPTANALSLDADVIIAAQASLLIEDGDEVVIATTNPKHLSLFVPAASWQDIN